MHSDLYLLWRENFSMQRPRRSLTAVQQSLRKGLRETSSFLPTLLAIRCVNDLVAGRDREQPIGLTLNFKSAFAFAFYLWLDLIFSYSVLVSVNTMLITLPEHIPHLLKQDCTLHIRMT